MPSECSILDVLVKVSERDRERGKERGKGAIEVVAFVMGACNQIVWRGGQQAGNSGSITVAV